jgi:ATP-dependent helicase HrpB
MARRWAESAPETSATNDEPSPGAILALAYPDRIAKNRGDGRFLLANGRGAVIDQASPLAREPFLAVAEVAGSATRGRIVLAAPISPAEIEAEFADQIEAREDVTFDPASLALRARRIRALGAIALQEQPIPVAADETAARKLAQGLAQTGLERLPWTKALAQWRDRVNFLRSAEGNEWPDLSIPALAAHVDDELGQALLALVPYPMRQRVEREAPTHFAAPSGSQVPIDYEAPEGPKLSIRVQELFGLDRHPAIAGGRVPLVVELLSPAYRPVQVTRDLPGFWRGSYAAVKSEMRGRYPRHPWPDDPLSAPATRRAKPRGQ